MGKLIKLSILTSIIFAFANFQQWYPDDEIGWNAIVPDKISKPDYLQPITEPTFGTQLTRITDRDVFGSSDVRHHYSKDRPWNSDGSLIRMKDWILDGHSYKIIKTINKPDDSRWSYTDPNKIFGVSGRKFVSLNVSTGKKTVHRKFSGSLDLGQGEGDISWDDKYAALTIGKEVIVYNIKENVIVTRKTMESGSWDWVTMSPSGKYVVINWRNSNIGDDVVAYNSKDLSFHKIISPLGEHADIGYDSEGNEVYVQVLPLMMTRLDNGKQTHLVKNDWRFSGHISCRNFKRPGWAYVTMKENISGVENYGKMEQFAVKLEEGGVVERFAHHRSVYEGYSSESHGIADPWGRQFMFCSNWQGTSDMNSYVAEIKTTSKIQPKSR